jgi:SsrA-binding protein
MAEKKDKKGRFKNASIFNRRASHEFHFLKNYEAGMMLQGTEVKALREGMANLNDSFCYFIGDELFLKNCFISEYSQGTYYNHESRRQRKLLLRRSELKALQKRVTEKGLTIVPYKIFFSERGFAKIEVCLAQGKKTFDKRDSLKERDSKREMDRLKKIKL